MIDECFVGGIEANKHFDLWMDTVDKLGQREGFFDHPDKQPICPGSEHRRPYRGADGFFRMAYESGMTPRQAIAESLVEQDCEL